ncbi:MAG: vanadium-dependent haloperoxidase [Rhodocyclaceae bacterium]
MFHTKFQTWRKAGFAALCATMLAGQSLPVSADVITDWNQRSAQFVTDSRLGTPPAVRLMALVQTAAYAAVRDAAATTPTAPHATDVAVAAAHRLVLTQLLPAQKAAVESAYQTALAGVADDAARARFVVLGERAAQRVLDRRADEMPRGPDTYRPHTTPGSYVPTALPAATQWGARKPWLLARGDQFRPAPPPALGSALWVRDYNEIRQIGTRDSKQRNADQTDIGRFWDYSLPAIYHGVVRSVALQPGRDVLANARLFALVSQAMDDALIAVMDAKYTYNFWRPVTAIRNGDTDGNDATERDAAWLPMIDTPMHPEYPCAHCILAGTVATVVKAEGRTRPLPALSTASPTAQGAVRSWSSPEDFMREVAAARIYGGVHYRNSTEVGLAMGQRIGDWALSRAALGED